MRTCPTCGTSCPPAPKNFPYHTKPTVVVLRRWREDGQVIALFPLLSEGPGRCQSYMQVGQHAPADYAQTLAATEPASALRDQDVRDLCRELTSAPHWYHLKPLRAEDVTYPGGQVAA